MKLDLNALENKFLTLTLLDKSELNLKRPNEDLYNKMIAIEDYIKQTGITFDEIKESLKDLVFQIMNRNKENKTFEKESFLVEYDYFTCLAIYKTYSQFTREVMSNPN